MSNTGERYHSSKAAQAAAQQHASETGKPYAIHQANPDSCPTQGWYVLAELTWSPISVEPDPEGAIHYRHVNTVHPDELTHYSDSEASDELEADVVTVSNAALRDQLGPDPALFEDSDSEAFKVTLPDELLVELQYERIQALERALKATADEATALKADVRSLSALKDTIDRQTKQLKRATKATEWWIDKAEKLEGRLTKALQRANQADLKLTAIANAISRIDLNE